jgi:hypothetical protein
MPLLRDRFGFRRGFDARQLAAPSCIYVYAITDFTAVKIGRSAGSRSAARRG